MSPYKLTPLEVRTTESGISVTIKALGTAALHAAPIVSATATSSNHTDGNPALTWLGMLQVLGPIVLALVLVLISIVLWKKARQPIGDRDDDDRLRRDSTSEPRENATLRTRWKPHLARHTREVLTTRDGLLNERAKTEDLRELETMSWRELREVVRLEELNVNTNVGGWNSRTSRTKQEN